MTRALALALLLLAVTAADAQATTFRVVVVPGLELDDLTVLEERGAIGLLVPGAGPETSAAAARAALVRGEARNSLRGLPTGPVLIRVQTEPTVPASGPAIVLGLPQGGTQPNDRRYPVAVLGGGFEGILTSESTRIPGLVSIADIAPTALGDDPPLHWQREEAAAQTLLDLDRHIDENNSGRLPVTIVAAVLLVLLALVRPRAALLGFGLALVANLALGIAGVASFWPVVVTIAGAIVLGGLAPSRVVRPGAAAGLFLAGVLLAYLLALGIDGPTVALSPLGPTQNARFYGISNLLETMLLVPAFAGAALLGGRIGVGAFAAVAVLTFVAVAGNRFGADGGGAIVLAVGFAVLAVVLYRLRGRALAAVVAVVLLLAGLAVALDALFGPSTHVTRAVGTGPGGLWEDLRDRAAISWERIAGTPAVTVLVAVGVVVLAFLVVRILRSERPWPERAAPLALAAAIATSLVFNDSPNDVILFGVVGLVVCDAAMLRARCAAASRSRSPWALSWPAVVESRPWRPRPRP
jgi:hypothetical protein